MTNQPKVCGTCGSDDPELYGGDCFLYPGPHDAFHDTPASEPTSWPVDSRAPSGDTAPETPTGAASEPMIPILRLGDPQSVAAYVDARVAKAVRLAAVVAETRLRKDATRMEAISHQSRTCGKRNLDSEFQRGVAVGLRRAIRAQQGDDHE